MSTTERKHPGLRHTWLIHYQKLIELHATTPQTNGERKSDMLTRISLILPGVLLLLSCTAPRQSPVMIGGNNDNVAVVASPTPVRSNATGETPVKTSTMAPDSTILPAPAATTKVIADTPTPTVVPVSIPPVTPTPSPTAT